MEIPTKEREEWFKNRIKLASEQNVIQCKYCGIYSGIYRITLKKFILPKSKQKVYLCNRHWDKAKELDDIIHFMNSQEYLDLKTTREKQKKDEELKAFKKKIIIIGVITISIIILFIFIFGR